MFKQFENYYYFTDKIPTMLITIFVGLLLLIFFINVINPMLMGEIIHQQNILNNIENSEYIKIQAGAIINLLWALDILYVIFSFIVMWIIYHWE